MSMRRIFQPLIMSAKPDGSVEYKPITTSDDSDESITNIFLPREEDNHCRAQHNRPQALTLGSARA